MKPFDIMRRRMRNTRLTGAPFDSVVDAVRWHGAMQGQDYGPAKWSIGQRATKLVDEDVDRTLNDGDILRTHALRPTWHLVARDDIRWILSLTGPRVHRQIEPRFRQLGLDPGTLAQCEKEIVSALEDGNHLTRADIAGVLDEAGIDRSGQRLPHILIHCELDAVICSGRLAGKQQTYALLDERAPDQGPFDRDEALAELVRRYLQSHGPATVPDLRWWSGLTVADIKAAVNMLGSEVWSETLDGMTFWSMTEEVGRLPSPRVVHLLQMLDEIFVGYNESRHFGDARADEARTAFSDRGTPAANILLRGRVAGHWKRTVGKRAISVELLLYEDPKPSDMRAMETAAKKLGRFVGQPVTVAASKM
jgi:hypothetical protein